MSERRNKQAIWCIAALALVTIIAPVLRLTTKTPRSETTFRFDERYIIVPITDILTRGWSIDTAIDFEETKGPAMVWTYAALGEVVGESRAELRLISVAFFILGVIPLLAIARRCEIAGPGLLMVALLYVLLPYHAPLGQLLMSEASFVFGTLCLMWIFLWGFGSASPEEHRIVGPVLFGLVLAIMLHHRIHAAAFAGAAALVAFERDRWRSWPWWLAGFLAGLSRVPLWLRWGGLVSPRFQGVHELGLSLEGAVYLIAALTPLAAALIWSVVDPVHRARRHWIWIGGVVGVVMGAFATPSLKATFVFEGVEGEMFAGMIASAVRAISSQPTAQSAIMIAVCGLGTASLAALAVVAWSAPQRQSPCIERIQFWTLITATAMYALSHAPAYDRYVLGWAALMPIVWLRNLPRWLLVAQIIVLTAAFAWIARAQLM